MTRGGAGFGLRSRVGRGVHLLEIFAHGRDGFAVGEAAHALDHRLVRDAEPEQKPVPGLLRERVLRRKRHAGFAVVDRSNAGGDDEFAGVREQPGGMREGVPADGFRNPESAVAKRFDALGGLGRFGGRHAVREVPDAGFGEIHWSLPISSRIASLR